MFEMTAPMSVVDASGPHARSSALHDETVADARSGLFVAMLDEIDYGMLLVAADGHALHVNHVARAELDADHPLQMLGQSLRTRRSADVAPLFDALNEACHRGLRHMVTLGDGTQRVTVAVLPLPVDTPEAHGRPALLLLGKRHVCEELSVDSYARSVALTPAETAVLKALCRGERPGEIARRHGVALSTVRTQVGSIRTKTGAESIGALVRQVAVLPPMVGALRQRSARLAA